MQSVQYSGAAEFRQRLQALHSKAAANSVSIHTPFSTDNGVLFYVLSENYV